MIGWKGWRLLKLEMNDIWTPPGTATMPEIFSTWRGEDGPTGRVQQVQSVNVAIALQRVGNADGMAVAEAFVGAHQQGFIGTVAAANAGLYGAVGTLHAGHRGLLRRASRDHRTAHGGVVVEVHAAQHFVDVVAKGEIGGDGENKGR